MRHRRAAAIAATDYVHPTLFHLGRVAVSTQGILVAGGLLAGLTLSAQLAPRLALSADRIWNLGFASLLAFFLGARLLVIAFNLRDFLAHPFWMLGLVTVRDERYAYGGLLPALCTAAGYMAAWRLPWRRALVALMPGVYTALACGALGSFAAGTDPGHAAPAPWGLLYQGGIAGPAGRVSGATRLLPIELYAALLYMLAALLALFLSRRAARPGSGIALPLFVSGLGTVLIQQCRYRTPGELLLFAVLTPPQALGAAAVLAAGLLWLLPEQAPETHRQEEGLDALTGSRPVGY